MMHLTKKSYKPRKGLPAQGRSMVQLSGYIPDEKRVTELIKTGMLRAAYRDDAYEMMHELDVDNLPEIPPIPRAFGVSTLADLSLLTEKFKERAAVINERLAMAAEAGKLKKKVAPNPSAEQEAPLDGSGQSEDAEAPDDSRE